MESPVIGSHNNFEGQQETKCIGFEYNISCKPSFSLSCDYVFPHLDDPLIIIKNPETNLSGFGIAITRYSSYNLGVNFKISFFNSRLNLTCGLYSKILNVKRSAPDTSEVGYFFRPEDYPYYGIAYPLAYPGTHIIPEIRFAIGVRFLWRMHLYINVSYAHGFEKTQDLVFEYSYKGVPQPKGVAYVNGTELRFHLGLKFDIVRCRKKEINNHINLRHVKKKNRYK